MILIKTEKAIQPILKNWKKKQKSTGFVPTMGALHDGHISLINACLNENDFCISSLFINPTQFNNQSDFEKYPITLEKDIAMLEAAGCNLLLLPSVTEIYPNAYIAPHYNLGYLETILEGKYRPGHFQGVCQVVDRLLDITKPGSLYLGQKDYQQCMVLKKLIEQKNYPNIKPGNLLLLQQQMAQRLNEEGFKVDYVVIASAATLETVTHWNGEEKLVALVAAYLNEVRLIDNMLIP